MLLASPPDQVDLIGMEWSGTMNVKGAGGKVVLAQGVYVCVLIG